MANDSLVDRIMAALGTFVYPLFDASLVALNAVESITSRNGRALLTLRLGVKIASHHARLHMLLANHLEQAGIGGVDVHILSEVVASADSHPANGARNILMVASGKGGVGKSSTAINLALALRAEGATVGVLDADIYGPSMRTMLGVADTVKPVLVNNQQVEPIRKYGLATMSVGYMSPDKTPMIWRGPMAVKALQQLLEQTLWGELDYLIIDMPPGTGDIHISLAQKLRSPTAVVVTTPQEVALIDARKGLQMFTQVGIPVLGVVENMATHICSNCGHAEDIFGAGGAQQLAEDFGVALLGSLPLDKHIREHLDSGNPSVARDPASPIAQCYLAVAHKLAVTLWQSNLQRRQSPVIEVIG